MLELSLAVDGGDPGGPGAVRLLQLLGERQAREHAQRRLGGPLAPRVDEGEPGRPDAVWAEANSFFGHDSKHAKMARQEIKNSQMKTPSFHSAAYRESFIPTGPTAPPPSSLPPQTVTQPP